MSGAENARGDGLIDSPHAARALLAAINEGLSPFSDAADDMVGATDCPEGCVVEPDGWCPHGYKSAALSARIV